MARIVVGIDGTHEADRALCWAAREAVLRHGTIELVHCYWAHTGSAPHRAQDRRQARELLDRVVERNRPALDDVKWDASIVGVGTVASTGLLDAGTDADLIVVGTRGSFGFQRLRLGSTGFRVARRAQVPVAVISLDGERQYLDGRRRIVVGVDDSIGARRAAACAVDEASRRSVDVEVVHAIGRPARERALSDGRDEAAVQAEDVLAGILDGLELPDELTIRSTVSMSEPADALLRWASADSLLVVGRQRDAGALEFGSVSRRCIHHASGPIVVVP